jgi:hypothetical protein
MQLATLRAIYAQPGPFATVYLEARPPAEDSSTQLRLRWNELRESLESAGAQTQTLDNLQDRLFDAKAAEVQADGRVLIASEGGAVFERDWDASLGAGDSAHWTHLPELGRYVREAARAIRALVIVTDQHGAAIRQEIVTPERHRRDLKTDDVEGDAVAGLHKPRGGGVSHNQHQRRAEEAIAHNAGEVAEAARKTAAVFHPHVVVLAGEAQGRSAVQNELTDEMSKLLVDTDSGGGDRHSMENTLAEDLARIADQVQHDEQRDYQETFGTRRAQAQATDGNENVAAAAELGAIDTLLFEDQAAASREAFLIKACSDIDSDFALLPAETGIADGVAALLRFPLPQ